MYVTNSFYILQVLLLLYGVIFAIRISSFKKDAWYFYFLATITGSLQYFSLNNTNLDGYINSLAPYCHDMILALVALLVYDRLNIKPKEITRDNLPRVIAISSVVTLIMIAFTYITSPDIPTVSLIIIDIFAIFVFVGSSLLALGYIIGLLINAIYSVVSIIMNIVFAIEYGSHSSTMFMDIFFNAICFIIFLYGYYKNKKLLS